MVGAKCSQWCLALHKFPRKTSLEVVNIFLTLMVQRVILKGEDYIMNYIDTQWHNIFNMSCSMILMPNMAQGEDVYVTMIMQ